jgi:hypothetical protein
MDKIEEITEKRINDLLEKIDKLTENVTTQHKHALKYKNKLLDLFKKMSEAKICPKDLIFNLQFCPKNRCVLEKDYLTCWKRWVNAN